MISNEKELNSILEYTKFKLWLDETEKFKEENIEELWKYIKIDILSEVANALWGKNSSYKIKSLKDKQILSAAFYMNAKEDTKLAKEIVKDVLCIAPEYGKKIARMVFNKDLKCGNIFMNLEEFVGFQK